MCFLLLNCLDHQFQHWISYEANISFMYGQLFHRPRACMFHSLASAVRMSVYQHCAFCIASSHANRRNVLQVVTVHQPNVSINHLPLWVCHRPRRRHPREGSTHHTGIPLHHPHPKALEGDIVVCQRQSPLQPSFSPSSYPCSCGVQVVT